MSIHSNTSENDISMQINNEATLTRRNKTQFSPKSALKIKEQDFIKKASNLKKDQSYGGMVNSPSFGPEITTAPF
jgi:hypothetical protein